MPLTYLVRFWLYLICVIPSILCTIFDLYYFLIRRVLRQALNNHVIIVILFLGLFYNLTDIIWFMHYYRTGSPLSSTPTFCLIWVYVDYAPFVSILLLVAWASIERHILVFHQNLVARQTKRFILHYLPSIILSVYPFIYYIIIFFVLPCNIPVDYTQVRCNLDNCVYTIRSIGQWDNIANNTAPLFIIVIFSIALLGRVWFSKYRIHQRFQWKNYRKMVVQLLSISSIYFIMYFPTIIMYTISIADISFDNMNDFFSIGYYSCYFVIMLTPFVCALSLPELRTKLQKMIRICHRTRRTVGPEILTMNRFIAGRTGGIAAVVH